MDNMAHILSKNFIICSALLDIVALGDIKYDKVMYLAQLVITYYE